MTTASLTTMRDMASPYAPHFSSLKSDAAAEADGPSAAVETFTKSVGSGLVSLGQMRAAMAASPNEAAPTAWETAGRVLAALAASALIGGVPLMGRAASLPVIAPSFSGETSVSTTLPVGDVYRDMLTLSQDGRTSTIAVPEGTRQILLISAQTTADGSIVAIGDGGRVLAVQPNWTGRVFSDATPEGEGRFTITPVEGTEVVEIDHANNVILFLDGEYRDLGRTDAQHIRFEVPAPDMGTAIPD